MLSHLRPALVMLVLFTILTGIAYPLAITGIAQSAFPIQANGSLVEGHGQPVGSIMIGQAFASPRYFWGRPSAAGASGYDAAASSGSNLGPTSAALVERVKTDLARLDVPNGQLVPGDAVTASGSGLDPHISPEYAVLQTRRVSAARHLPEAKLLDLIRSLTDRPSLGFIGEPRINVLRLNLALDALERSP